MRAWGRQESQRVGEMEDAGGERWQRWQRWQRAAGGPLPAAEALAAVSGVGVGALTQDSVQRVSHVNGVELGGRQGAAHGPVSCGAKRREH